MEVTDQEEDIYVAEILSATRDARDGSYSPDATQRLRHRGAHVLPGAKHHDTENNQSRLIQYTVGVRLHDVIHRIHSFLAPCLYLIHDRSAVEVKTLSC